MHLEKLATREDILKLQGEIQRIEGKMEGSMGQLEGHLGKLEGRVCQAIGNMAWKMTALLIAQTAAFMGLLKMVGGYREKDHLGFRVYLSSLQNSLPPNPNTHSDNHQRQRH